MEFSKIVQKRRSVRAFQSKPVTPEMLQKIMEAANRAPSAGNLQAYEIYFTQDARVRESLAGAALDQAFVAQAPLALVFCSHAERSARRYGVRGEGLYAIQDATIACTFAMLAATDMGLGSVWVGAFDAERVKRIIKAPQAHNPVAILPIGFAAELPPPSGRRPLSSFVHEV